MDRPPAEGVIRVDNYWCHSAILSTRPKVVKAVPQKFSSVNVDANVDVVTARSDKLTEDIVEAIPLPVPVSPPAVVVVQSSEVRNDHGSMHTMPSQFNPRARLEELQRNAKFKGGSALAAKLRSKAREAIVASRAALVAAQKNNRKSAEVKIQQVEVEAELLPPVMVSDVDLPGMSFITLFCDDQKVRKIRILFNSPQPHPTFPMR